MLFVELRFFLFFALVFAIHWALRGNTARKVFLLACSYFFYGCWDWRFVAILMASTAMDYSIGVLLTRWEGAPAKRRALVVVSLAVNLGLIAFFKYCNFFIASAVASLEWLGKIRWVRSSCPQAGNFGDWGYFETKRHTASELLNLAHAYPRLDLSAFV